MIVFFTFAVKNMLNDKYVEQKVVFANKETKEIVITNNIAHFLQNFEVSDVFTEFIRGRALFLNEINKDDVGSFLIVMQVFFEKVLFY